MFLEPIIKSTFEKHGIKDEKLESALKEILESFYQEITYELAKDFETQKYFKGIK
ncbi:hypothetical protein [Bacillus wiedmannii]|uniref:hypothetical protein n=1 Tax=Bacillus wiedmannii TaxID=1890302 RepID=UPI002E23863E|nr:hypothetical protein [Bacillus wiedmannii]